MNILQKVKRARKEYAKAFNEEIGEKLQTKIIVGSPVDTGRFKTSWVVTEYDIMKFKFRMVNPSKYGLKLWRDKHSLKGWSPTGGDVLLLEARNNLNNRFKEINKTYF